VRRTPGARLLIAGEGPLRGALEAQRDRLGIAGRVSLLGARHDVVDLMGAGDVFVLSSVREGLSITLLESMRAGLPAVVTAVGGNAEAVSEGVTGRLVPVADAGALGEALAHLLENPATRESMGREARARWQRSFTAERMVRETEALYLAPA
jgi:glycosyltransferase involved in cell wall biosynthesis